MARRNPSRTIGVEPTVAARIERELNERGWSPAELAKRMTEAGCSIQTSAIYKVIKGDPPRKISVDELVALSTVFQVSVEDLLVPIELLDQRRAHAVLEAIAEHENAMFEAVAGVLEGYTEYFQLAGREPDLHEYLANLRFAEAGVYHEAIGATAPVRQEESPPIFGLDDHPDWDSSAVDEAVKEFYMRLINLSADTAQWILGQEHADG